MTFPGDPMTPIPDAEQRGADERAAIVVWLRSHDMPDENGSYAKSIALRWAADMIASVYHRKANP